MRSQRLLVTAVLVSMSCATLAVGNVPATIVGALAPDRIDQPATVATPAMRLDAPDNGNPGGVPLPPEALPVDTSHPDRVVGTGTAASCTSAAVVAAVAAGGVITFDCGPDPVTITMADTAKVVNTSKTVVIDGGGTVTLSGGDQRRILYMNTCDQSLVWVTSHCQNQDQPQLTIQNLGFTAGNSTGQVVDGGGGGAVFVRGGRVRVLNSRFTSNRCEPTGPDIGGGALRVLSQYEGLPVIVADSTFGGGPATGNRCSNGGALSSIGVSWQVYNSVFVGNVATGNGANPPKPGTPGGGNGGAIALDGNLYELDLDGSVMRDNTANAGGGAIFFVSNNRTGHLRIDASTLDGNPSLGFETRGYPGIFYLGDGPIQVTNSTLR